MFFLWPLGPPSSPRLYPLRDPSRNALQESFRGRRFDEREQGHIRSLPTVKISRKDAAPIKAPCILLMRPIFGHGYFGLGLSPLQFFPRDLLGVLHPYPASVLWIVAVLPRSLLESSISLAEGGRSCPLPAAGALVHLLSLISVFH